MSKTEGNRSWIKVPFLLSADDFESQPQGSKDRNIAFIYISSENGRALKV